MGMGIRLVFNYGIDAMFALGSNQNRVIWIAWENHQRTRGLCSFLNIKPCIMTSNSTRVIKHPVFVLRTLLIIIRKKPKVLIVQNPSIVLTFQACVLRKIFGYRLIVDSHNAGIIPFYSRLNGVFKYLQRAADITIVTNENLAEIVRRNGGNPFILPDRIPSSVTDGCLELKGRYNFAFICTFASDEPYEIIIEAAKRLDKNYLFYITGNYRKAPKSIIENSPSNIEFMGFLPDTEYWRLLKSADFIIDLTNREDCLVCGAYEAVSVETPLILSKTKVLKNHFYKGSVFTLNTVDSLIEAIQKAIQDETELRRDVRTLKKELVEKSEEGGRELREEIEKLLKA